MKVRLENLASVTTGFYGKINPAGNTFYLQGKQFDESGLLYKNTILSPDILINGKLERHLLKDGDLLIMAKGESNKVCYYSQQIGRAVASSTFFVIRIQKPWIIPKYLQWYLNTSKMQAVLSRLSKGTHILSLSKKSLSRVKIEVPTLEKQQEVLKLQSLWEMERKTTLKLLEQKELFYENLLLNLATSKLIKND